MFDTLEEAQAEIVRLNDELAARTVERDTLTQNNENLTAELDRVRTLNQRYFERLIMQDSKQDEAGDGREDDPTPSCEEFAKTLKI